MIKVYNLTFEGHKNSGNIKKRPPLYGIFLLSLLLFLHRGTLQCKQNKLHLSISITEMYRINRESYRQIVRQNFLFFLLRLSLHLESISPKFCVQLFSTKVFCAAILHLHFRFVLFRHINISERAVDEVDTLWTYLAQLLHRVIPQDGRKDYENCCQFLSYHIYNYVALYSFYNSLYDFHTIFHERVIARHDVDTCVRQSIQCQGGFLYNQVKNYIHYIFGCKNPFTKIDNFYKRLKMQLLI